jgi:hypothetical protein
MTNSDKKFAELLRAAAAQTIPEEVFWIQFRSLCDGVRGDAAVFVFESATHYWGNFHARNVVLMRVEPDQHQLEQGRNELNLIADAIEGDWLPDELACRLKDI